MTILCELNLGSVTSGIIHETFQKHNSKMNKNKVPNDFLTDVFLAFLLLTLNIFHKFCDSFSE